MISKTKILTIAWALFLGFFSSSLVLAQVPSGRDGKPQGSSCTIGSECYSGFCSLTTTGGSSCQPCVNNSECDGGKTCDTSLSSATYGHCLGGGTGSGSCQTDELCKKVGNTEYCRINGLCVPKPQGNVGGLIGSSTVFEVIAIVLKWLLTLAGVVATVFIIIGGYQYITAVGNEELAEKGRKTLINAVIGVVVVVLSMAIVSIITNTLGSTEPLGSNTHQEKII